MRPYRSKHVQIAIAVAMTAAIGTRFSDANNVTQWGNTNGYGPDVILTNAVTDTAGIDPVYLTQAAIGAWGSNASSGFGGVGGHAGSNLVYTDLSASLLQVSLIAYGGTAGNSGPDANGVNGGNASVSGAITGANNVNLGWLSQTTGAEPIAAAAGDGSSPGGVALGGGDGGIATIGGANATSTGSGEVNVYVRARGGTGGSAFGNTRVGGSGGGASLASGATIKATTHNDGVATAWAEFFGGHGGVGAEGDAHGGNGAVLLATNLVDADTGSGGTINLTQIIHGGDAGGDPGWFVDPNTTVAGLAGDASSTLSVQKSVAQLNVTVEAWGGRGGDAYDASDGADATASATAINLTGGATATATALAGNAGYGHVAKSNGAALATASATAYNINFTKQTTTSNLTVSVSPVTSWSTGILDLTSMTVGVDGSPVPSTNFTQSGGTITIAQSLVVGASSGSTDTYTLSGGTLTVPSIVLNATGAFSYSGGTLNASNISGAGSLTVGSSGSLAAAQVLSNALTVNGTVTLAYNGTNSGTSKVNSLTIAGSTNAWTGTLDIDNNRLIVQTVDSTAKAAAMATISNQVISGSTGIISTAQSLDTTNTAMAVADNGMLGYTSWGGQTVDSNSILVTYALMGDANLDDTVDFMDFTLLSNNYGQANKGWAGGDFNASGTTDFTDFVALSNHYNMTLDRTGSSFMAFALQADASAVPEPASLMLLGIGALGLARRRRVN